MITAGNAMKSGMITTVGRVPTPLHDALPAVVPSVVVDPSVQISNGVATQGASREVSTAPLAHPLLAPQNVRTSAMPVSADAAARTLGGGLTMAGIVPVVGDVVGSGWGLALQGGVLLVGTVLLFFLSRILSKWTVNRALTPKITTANLDRAIKDNRWNLIEYALRNTTHTTSDRVTGLQKALMEKPLGSLPAEIYAAIARATTIGDQALARQAFEYLVSSKDMNAIHEVAELLEVNCREYMVDVMRQRLADIDSLDSRVLARTIGLPLTFDEKRTILEKLATRYDDGEKSGRYWGEMSPFQEAFKLVALQDGTDATFFRDLTRFALDRRASWNRPPLRDKIL